MKKNNLCYCFNEVMPNRTVCRECFNKKVYKKRNQIKIKCIHCNNEITKRGAKHKYCKKCYQLALKLFPNYINLILQERDAAKES